LLRIHDSLEDYLYNRFAELVEFSGTRYLYDITNTYFEGRIQQFTDRLIFVKSEAKQAKEDGIVAGQRNRFEKGIRQIRDSLSKPKGHKKIGQVHQRIGRLKAKNTRVSQAFDIKLKDDGSEVTHLEWSYNPDHEQRNGTYIIRTSLPVESPKRAWQAYHTFTTIGAVNRCCKTDLNMRPVYHQKDEPIKAHLFLTLLACNIATFIRHLFSEKRHTVVVERNRADHEYSESDPL
jgi:transposase